MALATYNRVKTYNTLPRNMPSSDTCCVIDIGDSFNLIKNIIDLTKNNAYGF